MTKHSVTNITTFDLCCTAIKSNTVIICQSDKQLPGVLQTSVSPGLIVNIFF